MGRKEGAAPTFLGNLGEICVRKFVMRGAFSCEYARMHGAASNHLVGKCNKETPMGLVY
jgi:hypothetical protein